VAQTENLRPNLVDLGDTQQMGQIDASRSEHGISNRTILWALIAAIALALAALGVGVIALTSTPDAVAGPQGPTGLQGATGAEGIQGVPGPQGASGPQGATGSPGPAGPKGATGLTGKQGPPGPAGAQGVPGPAGASGTIVASTVVSGMTVLSAADPPVGTTVAATASCPPGVISLGGGAQVSATGFGSKNVTLRSSFPAGANGWRAVASVIGPLGAREQMAVHPYVLCGKASGTQSAAPTTT
jgi:hypothetical protein